MMEPDIDSSAPSDWTQVIERSQAWFRREQFDEGFWWAELESNATMDAEYILMNALPRHAGLGDLARRRAGHPRAISATTAAGRSTTGAPGDLSTTIECYFALLLTGDSGPHLARARRSSSSRGGVARARVFTRIWLALCGEWSWNDLPAMPIELMLLPARAPISIYRFASWARATIVPLLILMNDRPVRAGAAPRRASPSCARAVRSAIEPRDALDRDVPRDR